MPTEEMAYNALALLTAGSYRALRDLKRDHSSWLDCLNEKNKNDLENIDPEKEWLKLEALGIRLVLKENGEYPRLLCEIPHAPNALYIKGSWIDPGIPLAMVGTRRSTPKGKALTEKISRELTEKKCAIISGLALGIDAAAHSSCLGSGGYTVAVLAHGLDAVHPGTNAKLAENILARGGALISEYPLGIPPQNFRFLERNRIVSGLSKGVIAIEVPARSGVIATARFALEQNRIVWVLPGPTDHPNFEGSHALIRAGATLIRNAKDILEDLALPFFETPIEKINDPEQAKILNALKEAGRTLTIDEIIETTTLLPSVVHQNLTLLILGERVREIGGGYSM